MITRDLQCCRQSDVRKVAPIDALIALGPDAPEPALIDEIQHCVQRFNDLDEDEGFIETIEREDICEAIDRMADLIGLDDYGEALEGGRDW